MKFRFEWWASFVDNREWKYSTFRRMCQSATLELSIPFTEYHLLTEITCSLLPWHAKPDAWEVTTDGWPTREKVFPYAEWVPCPECGEDVINDQVDDHIKIQHEGEHKRFPPYGHTREEYADT